MALGGSAAHGADVVLRSSVALGIPAAGNVGAGVAAGEYLLFLTGRWELDPTGLERSLASARSGVDVVVPVPEGDDIPTCGLLVRRTTFEAVGGFDEGFHPGSFEAEHLVRQVRGRGGSIVFQSGVLATAGPPVQPADLLQHIRRRGRLRLEELWSLPAGMEGRIDAPDQADLIEADELELTGWALDQAGPPDAVMVLGGARPAQAHVGLGRADAAAQRPAVPRSEWAGWSARVDVGRQRGTVKLTALGRRGREWQEFAHRELTVLRRAEGKPRRPVAVFTIVQNEAVFLPVWLRHYGLEFDADDLYVLDHDSTDGSVDAVKGAHVVPVHRAYSFDHRWLCSTVEDFQKFLLRSYDAVVFTDVDELLVVDPARGPGLTAYVHSMTAPAARATGWNVVQGDDEGPWDPVRPTLGQRRWWHRAPMYDKVLVTTVALSYDVGFHSQRTLPDLSPDPGLILLHLHRVDRARCLDRHRSAAARQWSRRDLDLQYGSQNRVVDESDFERWYRSGPDLGAPEPQPVPSRLQGLA